MNPEQLLAHFDRVAEAPTAIARLRLFIIDLAMRGRLVDQDRTDEPAHEALKRFHSQRERQKTGGNKKRRLLPLPLPTEVPFSLPAGWTWARLEQVSEFENGDRSTNYPSRDEFVQSGIPFINAGHLEDGRVSVVSMNYIRQARFDALNGGKVQDGDVLFCLRGSLGKAALVKGLEAGAIASSLVIVRWLSSSHAPFLLNYFSSSLASRMVERFDNGTAQPNLSSADLRLFLVPVPPLSEQQRISDRINELMALCDRLKAAQAERERSRDLLVTASLQRLSEPSADSDAFGEDARFYLQHMPRLVTRREHLEQLRQTILNLAVRGRLVPQNAQDEPTSLLHARLKAVLFSKRKAKSARTRRELLAGAIGFFDDGTFPPSWIVTSFDAVNEIVSGVAKGKNLRGQLTATFPYLRVANVQRGYLDLDLIKELEIPLNEFERYHLRKGDVLMTEGGDWDKLGRAAIWNEEIPNCIHQNHIYRIRSVNTEELLPAWMVLFANSPLGRSYFERASKQTTNLASINMTQLRSCPLPLPPVAEQRRIVAKVDELMAVCDRLEAQLADAQTESPRLLEAVLHKALESAAESREQPGNASHSAATMA